MATRFHGFIVPVDRSTLLLINVDVVKNGPSLPLGIEAPPARSQKACRAAAVSSGRCPSGQCPVALPGLTCAGRLTGPRSVERLSYHFGAVVRRSAGPRADVRVLSGAFSDPRAPPSP